MPVPQISVEEFHHMPQELIQERIAEWTVRFSVPQISKEIADVVFRAPWRIQE